jgi:hypothetical protein
MVASAFSFADIVIVSVSALVVYVVWTGDDWITGGDDDARKRKRARVRLRMPKLVKIRSVDRSPVPV